MSFVHPLDKPTKRPIHDVSLESRAEAFIRTTVIIADALGIVIGHEDEHGSFILYDSRKVGISNDWFECATVDDTDYEKLERERKEREDKRYAEQQARGLL